MSAEWKDLLDEVIAASETPDKPEDEQPDEEDGDEDGESDGDQDDDPDGGGDETQALPEHQNPATGTSSQSGHPFSGKELIPMMRMVSGGQSDKLSTSRFSSRRSSAVGMEENKMEHPLPAVPE